MVAIDKILTDLAAFSTIFNSGFSDIFRTNFDGKSLNTAEWNMRTNTNYNNEVQAYTTSTENVRLSGDGNLQIIPRRSGSGEWTSGRLESTGSWTPADGKLTRFEARLRFGDSPASKQQGIWPAFWLLGDSYRHGVDWPNCGELDIMERKNGEKQNHATPHCANGAACGRTMSVALPDNGWHTWAIEIDRTNPDWKAQSLKWWMDENNYRTMKGAEMADEGTWKILAHSPVFIILNVAVGGDWPGPPNGETAPGEKNMLEVDYVSVTERK